MFRFMTTSKGCDKARTQIFHLPEVVEDQEDLYEEDAVPEGSDVERKSRSTFRYRSSDPRWLECNTDSAGVRKSES